MNTHAAAGHNASSSGRAGHLASASAMPKAISDEEAGHQMNKEEAFRANLKSDQQKPKKYIIPGPGGNGTF